MVNTEKETIAVMIKMYCKHNHGNHSLCTECNELLDYAILRINKCKFGNEKPVCNFCPVHCYKPEKREQVRKVMRWAGPRMIYSHPILAIKHLFHKKQNIPA